VVLFEQGMVGEEDMEGEEVVMEVLLRCIYVYIYIYIYIYVDTHLYCFNIYLLPIVHSIVSLVSVS
jgi:hypothetical protein